ncbi:uncharacterized protein LOC132788243 [Drosophila nasuta]|uniref:uncharacterized protein LOC132788243 n=1 Tax=Drosophila nasuta TaxID=42062 RepID=UPI00295F4A53|nr:uncharacterized protein LOC132788243 [Drosophila nasuta]
MWNLFIFLLLVEFSASVTRFTNINCEVLEASKTSFKECELKVLGRGKIGLNLHMELNFTNTTNVKENISLFRRFSGFCPFMFNKTFDFCKFMANSNSKLSFEKLVLGSISQFSNLNHSCPYTKDIIIRNMLFKEEFLEFLPLPSGEYRFQFMTQMDNIWNILKAPFGVSI